MNFVFDNNVFVSASLSKSSVPDKAFDKARALGKLIVSESILEELQKVLYRSKFNRYFNESDRKRLLMRYKAETVLVTVFHQVSLCRDPKDNQYLELALSGKANCIITGDLDLLALNPFENIPIISPSDFLNHY